MPTLSAAVVVIYLFIFRRIINTSSGRRDHGCTISLAQFCGVTDPKTDTDYGTGLSRSAVKRGLKTLIEHSLIGRKKGAGTNADFYYLRSIPKIPTASNVPGTGTERASGFKKNPLRPKETGSKLNPERVQKEPASGFNLNPVLCIERTHEITLERKQAESPPSVAVAVRPREAAFSDCSTLFDPWFDGEWTPRFGSHHRADAKEVWLSVVTLTNMQDLIECTRSYVASRNPESTEYVLHPQNFLKKFGKNQFKDRWKPFRQPLDKHQRVRDEALAVMKELRRK